MRAFSNDMSAPATMTLSFDFRDLHCYANPANPRSYYFLPSAAGVRRDATGHPMISLLDVGATGSYLMFTATWQASAASLDALRREIAAGHQDPDADSIQLAFAPLSGVECHALLGDGSGQFKTVGTSATSGMPPYDAVFNLSVPPDRAADAARAVRGEAGFLAVEYVADLRVPSVASAAFRSDSGELLPWLREARGSGVPMRTLLEEAVELGLATVTIDAPDHPGGQLAIELFDRVLTQAALVAPRWITEGDYGTLAADATVERDSGEPIRAFADVGGLVVDSSTRP